MESQSNVTRLEPTLRMKLAGLCSDLCDLLEVQHLLDYRCGAAPIINALRSKRRMKVQIFEPSVDEFAAPPIPADFVFYCCDEHLEDEEDVDALMRKMSELCGKGAIVAVPETHVDYRVWIACALKRFDMQTFQLDRKGLFMVVYPMEEQLVLPN